MIRQNHDLTGPERVAHAARSGGYNSFPPGWKELNAAEFAKSDFFGWTMELVEYRQMFPDTKEQRDLMGTMVVSASLYWMPSGYGYAIVNDFWGGTIRYFRFGEQRPDWLKGVDSSG